MKNYVFVTRNLDTNHANYLSDIDYGYSYSENVNDAIRFEFDEILELVKENPSLGFLGFSVARIEDCTFDKLKIDEELQVKYTDFMYVIR